MSILFAEQHRLEATIKQQQEQLRVVLAHVEDLRARIEQLKAMLLKILQQDDPDTGVGAFFDDITAVLELD